MTNPYQNPWDPRTEADMHAAWEAQQAHHIAWNRPTNGKGWLAIVRNDKTDTPPAAPAEPFDVARGGTSGVGYAQAALDAECDKVARATQPGRNHKLNEAAFSLGQLVAGGELDEYQVIRELTAAAELCGLANDPGCGPRGIANTIASGMSAGARSPRTVPPREERGRHAAGDAGPTGSHGGDGTGGSPDELVERLRSALVDSAGLDSIPEPDPVVDQTLFVNSTNWLIGAPGNGKSFVALDLAGCVATGQSWQGRASKQGNVFYLVAEGLSGIRQRVRAWEASMGIAMENVLFLPVAVQAASRGDWWALVQLVAELRPALIVIDTQARVTVGLEENSAKDMGEFVDRAERLRTASGACVLIVHHQGRSGDHMRGSTAMEGAATTIIKVAKDDDVLTIECTKQKDAPEFEPFALRLVSYDSSAILSPILDGTPQRTDTLAVRRMLADWWDSHETDWVSVTTLIEARIVSKNTFHRTKKSLERANVIEIKGEGTTRRYRLSRKPDSP